MEDAVFAALLVVEDEADGDRWRRPASRRRAGCRRSPACSADSACVSPVRSRGSLVQVGAGRFQIRPEGASREAGLDPGGGRGDSGAVRGR